MDAVKILIFPYANFDGIVSSSVIKSYYRNANVRTQTFFLSNEILTSGTKLFKKYIKRDYRNVYFINLSEIKHKVFWIVGRFNREKIVDPTMSKIYVFDNKDTLYKFFGVDDTFQKIITVRIKVSKYTFTWLSSMYDITLPDELLKFVHDNNNVLLNQYVFLTKVYGNEAKILSKLEDVMVNYISTGVDSKFSKFFLDKDFRELIDNAIYVNSKLYNIVDNEEKFEWLDDDVLVFDKTDLSAIDISDKFIAERLVRLFEKKSKLVRLVFVVEKDRDQCYIYTTKSLGYKPYRLCKELDLECKGYYTSVPPKEVYSRLKARTQS